MAHVISLQFYLKIMIQNCILKITASFALILCLFSQAVKLESARYGRTRYLVVVSCSQKPAPRKSTQSQQQQQQQLINAQNIINSKGISSSLGTRSGSNSEPQQPQHQNSHSGSTPSPHRKSNDAPATVLSATLKGSSKHLINEKDSTNLSRLSTSPKQDEKYLQQQQQQPSPHAMQQPLSQQIEQQSDEIDPNQMNEEACLLGIDCNEKTTVGLVLRILGDTTIRLDGDG